MRLKNILIVVEDIEKSKAFYRELFGLDVITDFGGNVILTEGLVLQERKGWEALTGASTAYGGHDAELYFVENDMDSFIQKLESSNLAVTYVNRDTDCDDGGRRVIRIYDPDRHVIEIGESVR